MPPMESDPHPLMGPNIEAFTVGFFLLGLEIGSRNPGDRIGVWLKKWGFWPW